MGEIHGEVSYKDGHEELRFYNEAVAVLRAPGKNAARPVGGHEFPAEVFHGSFETSATDFLVVLVHGRLLAEPVSVIDLRGSSCQCARKPEERRAVYRLHLSRFVVVGLTRTPRECHQSLLLALPPFIFCSGIIRKNARQSG